MSIAAILREAGKSEVPSVKAPKDVPRSARTTFDGEHGEIETAALTAEPTDYDELLREFGYDPAQVQIVGHPRVSKWQQSARNLDTMELETSWLSAYRFNIERRATIAPATELEALIASAKSNRVKSDPAGAWFVFQAGDLQIGKRARDGGTDEIIEKFVESVGAARDEMDRMRRRYPIAGVQLSFPGDCIEGNVSQGGKNAWLTSETITEQTRIFRRLLLLAIDEFRSAGTTFVDVINGNHDQAQRQWNSYPGDGWATEAAIAVSDALELNTRVYRDVHVRVPEKWSGTMTVNVGDTVVTVAHGHQWNRNGAMKWWSEQALHNQPAAAAHVLQNGHLHEVAMEMGGARTRIQSPTFDGGSDWWRERHGAESPRGGLIYTLKAGRASGITLV